MLVYNGIFQQIVPSALAHKFTNNSAESITGKKQNLLTEQEPERTYKIDFFKK